MSSVESNYFEVEDSDNKGFIRRSSTIYSAAYKFDDETRFFPTGTNLHFYDHGICKNTWENKFLKTIDELARVDANFARLLISGDEWGDATKLGGNTHENGFMMSIESGPSGILGNYDERQYMAYLLDRFIEYSDDRNINLQLCLFTHTQGSASPYSQIPAVASNPSTFHTNPTAIKYAKSRIRYVLSRWGYATNIFAWELQGEADLVAGLSQTDLVNWENDMAAEMKTIDPNHMITTSAGFEYFEYNTLEKPHGIYSNSYFDFIDHHTYEYTESFTSAHMRREGGLHKINDYSKPLMAGEFGSTNDFSKFGGGSGYFSIYNFNPEKHYNNIEFHNGIWASSFSGQFGTSSFWYSNLPLWLNNLYNHIKPLRSLINEIDFQNDDFIPITSDCELGTPAGLNMTQQTYDYLTDPITGFGPNFDECPNNIQNKDITTYVNATTTNDLNSNKLLILGIKNESNIYGWMQKKDNFWWKLPHVSFGNTALSENCNYSGSGTLPSSSSCHNEILSDTRAIFNNICDGEYYIDYYMTYPFYKDGTNDGGIIPDFTRRLFTTNNTLDVKPPTFKPLRQLNRSNEEFENFAPDYGYHIRTAKRKTFHDVEIDNVTYSEEADPNGDIEAFYDHGSQIFYQGKHDGLMHQYYFDYVMNDWRHGMMNSTQNSSEIIDGHMSAEHDTETGVFYRGIDGKLHVYYFDHTAVAWIHYLFNTIGAQDVHQDSYIEATGEQVFYRGTDDKMHMNYFDHPTHQWIYKVVNPSATSNENVYGDIKVFQDARQLADVVFYKSDGGGLSCYFRGSTNSAAWQYDLISPAPVNIPYDEQVYGHILPAKVNNEIYCFYVGADAHVQYYKTSAIVPGATWIHGWAGRKSQNEEVTLNSYLDFDNGVLYYQGATNGGTTDNYINMFYWDNAEWRHAAIYICDRPSGLLGLGNFRLELSRNIAYIGSDNKVRIQYADDACTQCPNTIPLFRSSQDNSGSITNIATNSLLTNKPVKHFYTADSKTNSLSTKNIYGNSTTDISNQIEVFPNPTTDKINIKFKGEPGSKVTIKLVNTLGITVKNIPANNNLYYSISVDNIPRGLYYLYIEESGKLIAKQKISVN